MTTSDPDQLVPTSASPDPPTGAVDPDLRRGIEAVLFLADEPVDVLTLAEVTESEPENVEAALGTLVTEYLDGHRGMEIRGVAGGWRMYTALAAKPAVERWALAGRTGRLTQAALETLAVIAYKQPISRLEIGDIRGVNADAAVRSLVARGFVVETGRDPGPGQAVLYGTSPLLLERLGLDSLADLPSLTEFLPEAPAPDEPDLSALKAVRRRLAEGGDLPTRSLGGRSASETNTGVGTADTAADDEEDDEDVLPAPRAIVGSGRTDLEMDELTDRLEVAARNAVGRLRAAVAATDPDEAEEPEEPDEREEPDEPDAREDATGEDPRG
jgi:segregation and condensation protein B